jgi:hypothetical protein
MTPNKTAPPVARKLAVRLEAPPLPPVAVLVPVGVGVVPVEVLLLTTEEIEEIREEALDWMDDSSEDRLEVTDERTEEAERGDELADETERRRGDEQPQRAAWRAWAWATSAGVQFVCRHWATAV